MFLSMLNCFIGEEVKLLSGCSSDTKGALPSNRDTHCSHLALHGRAKVWQKAAEAPSVDTVRSFNITKVTFNWKHLTKDLPVCASDELNKKTNIYIFLSDVYFLSLHV